MLPNTVLVMNGKGGVAKTSLVANLAGLAAHSGWRTLAIDTDPQGNLARDVGRINDTDDGHNLTAAILGRVPLQPMRDVRPGLDLVPGGAHLDTIPAEIQTFLARGHSLTALGGLDTALRTLAGEYDLIVIDSPPGERLLQTLVARAACSRVVPTAPDDCSIDGLAAVFDHVRQLQTDGANPDLAILGVALTLTVTSASAVRRRVCDQLHRLLGDVTVFDNTIRFAQAAAVDCRRTGRLAHEYEADAQAGPTWWQRRQAPSDAPAYSAAAGS